MNDVEDKDNKDQPPADLAEEALETAVEVDTDSDTATESPPPVSPRSGRGAIVLGLFALLVAGGSLAANAWLWLTLQNNQQLLANRIDRVEQSVSGVRSGLDSAMQKLSANIDQLGDSQRSLKAMLDKTRELVGSEDNRDNQWSVEEIHQLLLLAEDQLTLARNVAGAVAALRTADQRIVDSGEPRLAPIREQIAQDIATLEQVPKLDLAGISHRLAALEKGVDRMPLTTRSSMETSTPEQAPAADAKTASGWQAVLDKLGVDLSGLVRIRRIDQTAAPLLPTEQQYFLRENIKTRLNVARLALLQHEPKIYRDSLLQAQDWIRQFFATDSQPVQWALKELEELASIDLHPDLPDISRSLNALDNIAAQDGTS